MPRRKCPGHHYVFPAPNGPTSRGVCKHCGAKTTGANAFDTFVTPSEWNRGQGNPNAMLFARYQPREEPD